MTDYMKLNNNNKCIMLSQVQICVYVTKDSDVSVDEGNTP